MMQELVHTHYNKQGQDISDIVRGKILMLTEVMGMRNVFKTFDVMKTQVEKLKGGNS